jgi:alpha-L-fucosidase
MPNGQIQAEFTDTLKAVGKWLKQYGRSIYSTRGRIIPPQDWGVATRTGKEIYLHFLRAPVTAAVKIPGLTENILSAEIMGNSKKLKWNKDNDGLLLYPEYEGGTVDHIVVLHLK